MPINKYVDEDLLRRDIARVGARALIGGHWDSIGQLQSDYLRQRGMLPQHTLLDLGCGCLRAGVKIVPWLNAGNYYGIDVSSALLDEGRKELIQLGLSDRVPIDNLRVTGDFDIEGFPRFDFGIAQSVFTHLPLEYLPVCLKRLGPNFRGGGLFLATFFIGPPHTSNFVQEGGKPTHSDRDPFHFEIADIMEAARSVGWQATWIGDWGHPRNQKIAEFSIE